MIKRLTTTFLLFYFSIFWKRLYPFPNLWIYLYSYVSVYLRAAYIPFHKIAIDLKTENTFTANP